MNVAQAIDRPLIGQILVADGCCAQESVHEAIMLQRQLGGKLGDILVGMGAVNGYHVASALSQQHSVEHVSLIEGPSEPGQDQNAELLHLMPERFWWDNLMVPLSKESDGCLVVAAVDPQNDSALDQLRSRVGASVDVRITAYRDVREALLRRYSNNINDRSRSGLRIARPHDSAHRMALKRQIIGLIIGIVVAVVALVVDPTAMLVGINAVVELSYLGLFGGKFGVIIWGLSRNGRQLEQEPLELNPVDLPMYTILVPAYHEAAILPTLVRALTELDYPRDRLDVKLLLEEDDFETRKAALALKLPSFMDIVLVPASQPRTKPKACNYGLEIARGEFVVIFDAEDIPDPKQLRRTASMLAMSPPSIACVQAKLAIYNRRSNFLTHWFAAEYMAWFDLLLPALQAAGLPIPLGGTSNHFRVTALREIGGWDPHNVTEDADLGVRLHRAGYRTSIVDSSTYEEAPTSYGVWVRQRTRWIKGYMQTWLVHMRHPVTLWKDLGPKGFVGFHALIGGTPTTFLLTPVYALLTTLWALTQYAGIAAVFPGWVYDLAMVNIVAGTFAFTYIQMISAARRGAWDTVRVAALSPLYWYMMSLASWRALYQLLTRPSYWEKTPHGSKGAFLDVSPSELSTDSVVVT